MVVNNKALLMDRFLRLNSFIYEESYSHRIKMPDIPAYMNVHFAQCAEDIIIAALLSAYAHRKDLDIASLTYCEIGGNHPISTSATYLLNIQYGMKGVIVEANPKLIPDLKSVRTDDQVLHFAVSNNDEKFVLLTIANESELSSLDHSFVDQWPGDGGGVKEKIFVPSIRITRLFEKYFPINGPDYLSIDVEGLDLSLIQDLDLTKYRPYIVQMEPSDHHVEKNTSKMISHMEANSYMLIARTDVNLVFVDQKAFVLPNNDTN